MALYSVAGLTNKIELPVPLVIDLLPIRPNVRSGRKRAVPGYWIQHETGNPNPGAGAKMHSNYLKGIPDNMWVSFHFAVDDGVIYQMVPIDEITWQAADGSGPGNMSGISCELCINEGIDVQKSRTNAEALAGGIMKSLNMGIDLLKRHWDFNAGTANRHHCPDNMMTDGYWDNSFVPNVAARLVSSPVYAKPLELPFELGVDTGFHMLNKGQVYLYEATVEALKDIIPRQYAESNAPRTGLNIPVRSKVKIYGDVYNEQNQQWFFLGDGSRVRASHFTPSIKWRKR